MGENLPFRSLDDVDGEARCDVEQMRCIRLWELFEMMVSLSACFACCVAH